MRGRRNILGLAVLALAGMLTLGAGPAPAAPAPGGSPAAAPGDPPAPGRDLARHSVMAPGARWTTVDHSKLEALQKDFAKPEEVTAACLSCHSLAANQIQHTIHWTWLVDKVGDGKTMGKNGKTINNFCIAVPSNEPRCNSCHIGYGWKDKNFDFTDKNKIDCLVCHDSTHTYEKYPTKAGYPVTEPTVFPEDGKTYLPPDYKKVAGAVARPDRVNCGACHFYGGGGDMVKHGDLDSSMAKPKKALDVHMDAEGLNFACQRCHTTKQHDIAGRAYSVPASQEKLSLTEADLASKIACESCHGTAPHKTNAKANDHVDKVACQTCHIPAFARELPTKMSWDWSTAGKKNAEGKPFKVKGPLGTAVYDTKKGNFTWGKDVRPDYRWFNGAMSYVLVTDKIDPSKMVSLNKPLGDARDPKSRIMPFKRHTGKQPYDKGLNTMVIPKLFGPPDSDAYWAKYDWGKAITAGMKYVDLPYSGQYGFVETEYFFPTTHMVAPAKNVVPCAECHTRKDSRLQKIEGVYMPGRDSGGLVTIIGWTAVLGSAAGAGVHGLMRAASRKRREK